jgi:ElaB/YqjD/DUF883 family membrane-anchored ribosome-binding protein
MERNGSARKGSHADDAVVDLKPALDRATEVAHKAVDRAAKVAAPTADWLGAQASAVRAVPDRISEGGRKVVTANPWTSLGVALALGLLLGRLLR